MRIELVRRSPGDIKADGVVVFVYEDRAGAALAAPVPDAWRPAAAAAIARRRFKAGRGDVLVVPVGAGRGERTLLLVGLGAQATLDREGLHRAAAGAARRAREERLLSLAVALPGACATLDDGERAGAVALGLLLGNYRFDRFVTDPARKTPGVEHVQLTGAQGAAVTAALARAHATAAGVTLARDLVNLPAQDLYPESMVAAAQRALRGSGVKVKVFGPRELQRERMGALLAVARGSDRPPRVVHLSYKPKGRARARLAFVGKGVTFDSGGYNIKSTDGMDTMKCDMAGAAAVLGAVLALARLGAPVEVHGVMGLAENLVSGNAYKPGDVLTARSGRTIEINNTDAEGRLVLADLLDYVRTEVEPAATIDLATLTGACVVALGTGCTGVFANDDALADKLLGAASRAGERMWRLPLIEEYREQLRSDIADTKNTGGRWGGAITAGLFLASFVDKAHPWAHLDIAGPAFLAADDPFWSKGGTGAGILTLIEYALSF